MTPRPSTEDTFVTKSRDLGNGYFSLTLGPYSRAKDCKPGSFVHVQLTATEVYFRRAMSVAAINAKAKEIEIIFKVFGRGTTLLSTFTRGARVNLLGPLGTLFTAPKKGEEAVMIAGGVGFPPLMFHATRLIESGYDAKKIHFYFGGKTGGDIVERQRIKRLGVNFRPVTENGSFGEKGLVIKPVEELLQQHTDDKLRIYSCGPEKMLKAIDDLGLKYNVPGQLSLEAPMPCGIGVCLGCVVNLRKGGHARVCADGPVFDIGEVLL